MKEPGAMKAKGTNETEAFNITHLLKRSMTCTVNINIIDGTE